MTEANKPTDPGTASGGRIYERLDRLFSEEGIAIPGDGAVLELVALGEHTLKYHQMVNPPPQLAMASDSVPRERFEGGEHTAIGDSATLYFSGSDSGTPAWEVELDLPNGLALTYGQIVALGGDFYGDPDRPISDGGTVSERMQRFTAAFNSLASLPASKSEAEKILAVMQEEIQAANQAINNGVQPHEAYDKLGDELSAKWNRITGGGSIFTPWVPLGRYLKLAATNWDHFGTWAVAAYKAGHAVALQQAAKAHRSGQRKDLELAYAMNAFADHFLSDLFSGGHLRTPRKQLYETVTPSDVGSLLSRYMHDEDCKFGLNVFNAMDESWHAYGDKRYFDTVDVANRNHVNAVVQTSVDEVFQSFSDGTVPSEEAFEALLWLPDLKQLQNHLSNVNYSALFVAQNNTVLRRQDINNLNDRNWTDNWWGSTTLALLKKDYDPKPPAGYLNPPLQAPTIQASGWQSHKPSPPNWVDGQAVRYAFSFTNGLNESYTGPWSSYVTLEGSYHPTLNVPLDATGKSTGRNIFRQFRGSAPALVGSLGSTQTSFIDQQN
ncbi:phospholipase [Pseudomonas rubra]|uniref:Phospholipase n=1 Tax=Pseudomonas rubra TaxID=2942627 RepID=A0ABT5PBL9_9PSED|nr:phospholipase [Pseudomonas rubra]MDD1015701.1 phospholipase [Pseudomonas rubra]MDD1040323.1 phospholipase [Pseudomonas rubra]MDD1153914.1 phospholipase [Pseudomonas rubra]